MVNVAAKPRRVFFHARLRGHTYLVFHHAPPTWDELAGVLVDWAASGADMTLTDAANCMDYIEARLARRGHGKL